MTYHIGAIYAKKIKNYHDLSDWVWCGLWWKPKQDNDVVDRIGLVNAKTETEQSGHI